MTLRVSIRGSYPGWVNDQLFFSTTAILAEEACSRDLRDMLLDHGETEIEHVVIVAARSSSSRKVYHRSMSLGWRSAPQK